MSTIFLVRPRGLEPPRVIHPLGPQPSASAIPPRPHVISDKNNHNTFIIFAQEGIFDAGEGSRTSTPCGARS